MVIGKSFQPEETKDDDREVKLTCREKNHSFFPRFTSLNETPPIGNIRCRREVGETPKHLRPKKTNSVISLLQGKNGILSFISVLHANSFRWKGLKKAIHLIFFESESKHLLSLLAAQRICETILQVNPQIPEYEILSSVNLERKKYELWMWFWSANFGSYVWFSRLWRSVSQRRMPREA